MDVLDYPVKKYRRLLFELLKSMADKGIHLEEKQPECL